MSFRRLEYLLNSLAWKQPVLIVAPAAVTLSGLQTIDGVTLEHGSRVLTPYQAAWSERRVWEARAGAWVPGPDFVDGTIIAAGTTISVLAGSQKQRLWTVGGTSAKRVGTDALGFERVEADPASGFELVQPDEDPTGATFYARVTALWAAGGGVALVDGATYKTSARLVPATAANRLFCDGLAVIQRGSSFASGAADDRTNCVHRIAGAATGSVSTTLSATAPMGSLTLPVTSGTGIVADMWLKLEGDNVADLFGGQSDAEVVVELVQVESVLGTTVTLKSRTCMHHAIGKPVVSYAPFVADPSRPMIEGVFFDWTGAGTTAVAVELTNALNVFLKRVEGRNFTRNVVDPNSGSKWGRLDDIAARGDCNGLIHAYSSHLIDIDRPRVTGEGNRVNAAGIPRPMLLVDDHCVGVSVRDVKMRKIAGMWRTWGGIMCGVDGFDVQDADGAEIVARDTFMLASNSNGVFGVIWDGGPSELSYATFHFHTYLRNGQAMGVTHPSNVHQCAIYAHDGPLATISNVMIGNKGQSSNTAGSYLNGIFISDTDGVMTNVSFHGVNIALKTRNFANRWQIDSFNANGSPGEGSQGTIGLLFDAQGGYLTSPIFRNVRIANFAAYFSFGTEWLGGPDYGLQIDRADFDGFIGTNVRALTYAAGPVGGTVLTVSGGSPEASTAAAPDTGSAICMGPSVNGWGFAAFDDGVAKHTGAAAVRGALLQPDASGNLVVTAAPTAGVLYRALVASASGYVTVQRIGLVTTTYTGLTTVSLTSGTQLGIEAPNYVYVRSNGGLFFDGVTTFRNAAGGATWGAISGVGELTLPVVAAASVTNPAVGQKKLFFDSSNVNKLTSRDSGGALVVIGTET